MRFNEQADGVIILDQTLLPGKEAYLTLTTAEEIWDAIYKLKVRGAPAIGVAAAYGIYVCARRIDTAEKSVFVNEFRKIKEYLAGSRPTAVNLVAALNRMERVLVAHPTLSVPEWKELLYKEAIAIREEDAAACRQIGENCLELLRPGMGILTHCNAGHLAVSEYGTALAPIYLGQERGYGFKVFADETRPLLQGARLTAYELSRAGVDVTLFVRGISCIVPGLEGCTDHVRVVSIVGRLLEHSRIYGFGPRDAMKLYLSSADLMTRNMDKRIEIAWPVLNDQLREEILGYLDVSMSDTAKLRELLPDGSYTPLGAFAKEAEDGTTTLFESQEFFIKRAQQRRLEAAEEEAAREANRRSALRSEVPVDEELFEKPVVQEPAAAATAAPEPVAAPAAAPAPEPALKADAIEPPAASRRRAPRARTTGGSRPRRRRARSRACSCASSACSPAGSAPPARTRTSPASQGAGDVCSSMMRQERGPTVPAVDRRQVAAASVSHRLRSHGSASTRKRPRGIVAGKKLAR